MTIDYATAIPDFREWVGRIDPEGCVAVVEVERDSPAWKAGLRPLDFISHINGKRIDTPREFDRQEPVTVRITSGAAGGSSKTIEP
jgi:serine protease Do